MSIANILQCIAVFAQWQLGKTYHGPGWWALGSALLALGLVGLYLRTVPGLTLLSVVAYNLLFIYGKTLLYIGTLRFFDQRERRRALIAFLIVYTLVSAYLTFIRDDMVMRRALLYVTSAALSFLTAWVLLHYKIHTISTSAHILSAVFLIGGVGFIVSALFAIASPPAAGVTVATLEQVIAMLNGFIMLTSISYGYILMINQRLNAESREARENLELIFNTTPDAVLITRVNDGHFVRLNDGFTALTGYTRADVIGKSALGLLWENPVDRQKVITALNETGVCNNLEAVFRHKNGQELIGSASARFFALNGVPHILSVTSDITERKAAEQEVRKLSRAVEQSPAIIVITNLAGEIEYANPKFTQTTGYTLAEVVGKNSRLLKSGHTPQQEYQQLWDTITSGGEWRGEFQNKKKNGDLYWESATIAPIWDQRGAITHFLAVKEDITERKSLEELLQNQAITDELTGVYNRRHFMALATLELKRAIRLKHPFAVAMIDLDHFKQVNDTYGHAAGDQVLIALSQIIQKQIRNIDVLARFGGDEFVLLFLETNAEQARGVIERVRLALTTQPIDMVGKPISLTLSSGIASLMNENESLDSLLRYADQALYRAKEAGRNRVEVDCRVA